MSDSAAAELPERTKITGERLEAVWPAARDRLVRHLMRTGVDADGAEDILQEVALRAMATSVEFSDLDDFCRWAYRVAHNLRIDQIRLETRVMPMRELPERQTEQDVASEVEHRIEYKRTLRAIAELRPSDRDAIIEAIHGSSPSTRNTAVRLAVRRHRARTRLIARLAEGVAAAIACFRASRRSVPRSQTTTVSAASVRSVTRSPATIVSAVALIVPAALLLAPHVWAPDLRHPTTDAMILPAAAAAVTAPVAVVKLAPVHAAVPRHVVTTTVRLPDAPRLPKLRKVAPPEVNPDCFIDFVFQLPDGSSGYYRSCERPEDYGVFDLIPDKLHGL